MTTNISAGTAGNAATWEKCFEMAIAGKSSLDVAAIAELHEQLETDFLLLDLNEDISEAMKHQQIIAKIDRLFGTLQKSESEAQAVIKKASVATAIPPERRSFPVTNAELLPNLDDPLTRFIELTEELCRHGDYYRIRDEYCRASILENLQGRLAPAFRPTLVTGKKYGDSIFKAIHRDHLVIDCHWLHVKNEFIKIRPKDIEFKPLFNHARPFPFEQAWAFANKNWTADHRSTDMLRLTDFQQCQLAALRSDTIKQRIVRIEQGVRKDGKFIPSPLAVFEQGLSAWCERDRRIHKYRESYVAIWRARSMLGSSASVRQVGELAAMMLGETPKDDKTTRDKEKNIIRHITGR